MSELVRVTLLDAERQRRIFPATFQIPDAPTRTGLRVGDFAKLCFLANPPRIHGPSGERMWVRIRAPSDASYEGVLDNEPTVVPLRLGDPVFFEPRHVLDWRSSPSWTASQDML